MSFSGTAGALVRFSLIPGCIWLPASAASAQALGDKAWIQVSAYHPEVDSNFQINGATLNGTVVDFETDLSLEHRDTVPAVSAGFRLGKRWRIGFDYYSLSRNGDTTLGRNIVVDDVTYPATATITSGFSSDIYRLTVGYSFVNNES